MKYDQISKSKLDQALILKLNKPCRSLQIGELTHQHHSMLSSNNNEGTSVIWFLAASVKT